MPGTITISFVLEVVFWGSVGLTVYSYLVYPFVIAMLAAFRRREPREFAGSPFPSVSLVIAFYNEEKVLPEKLSNLDMIDYPVDRIEFVLGSDGSDDQTNHILSSWTDSRRRVCLFDRRRGKAPVLNDLVKASQNEILLFSDANTLFEPSTVSRLVRHFSDQEIGGVCGKLILSSQGEDPGGEGEASYWEFENWVKQKESDYHTLLGATGGVYAIRRSLFIPLPTHKSVTDDFLIPLHVVQQGYRVVYSPDARATEKTSGSMRGEFRRKARIGAQNFAGIPEFASLLLPSAGFTAFALWSHKLIRWFVPLLALVAIGTTVGLAETSVLYRWFLGAEACVFLVAGVGYLGERWGLRLGAAGLVYYLISMNLALLVGFFRFASGRQRSTWEVRR